MATLHEDVVVGYHEGDIDFANKLATKFKSKGLSVWISEPNDDTKKISEAILGCKIYVPVMTEQSAVDKRIQDQLSLAYISNSALYPLSRVRFRDLSSKLNGGARLMLAKINWSFVFKDEDFEEKTDLVINSIKKEIENMMKKPARQELQDISSIANHVDLTLAESHLNRLKDNRSNPDGDAATMTELPSDKDNIPFWDRHFKGKAEVRWTELRDKFLSDYGPKIAEEYADNIEDSKNFFINLMYKDVFDLKKIVHREVYDKFCVQPRPHGFFSRMQEYCIAYLSLRDILSMNSSLRIPTIQNLGKFSFPAIVSGLSDMLNDDDPNIRAVAAIALAHAGKNQESTVDDIIAKLEDEDRLVRESACLSLGYLRSSRAVLHVVDRWRNDPISTVREAAELALSRMDAPDAQRCMKVTQILSSEMNSLKPVISTRL